MGLFDRGYTRRGIRKALRKSLRRRFSHAPPNSTPSRCAAMAASCASYLPRRKAINSLLVGWLPSGFFCPTRKTVTWGRSKAASSARTALRRPCGFSGLGDSTRNQTLSPLRGRKSRADQDDGYVRKKPWVSSLRGVLLVLFCRHGQKSTFIQHPAKLQFIISNLIILENPSKSKREAQFSRFLCKKI